MGQVTTYVGLDVHQKTIAVAVALAGDAPPKWLGTSANTPEAIARVLLGLGDSKDMLVCYEAGPCGFTLKRQLDGLGIACIVVAPALVPRRPGDQVKTDRRDALKLAKSLRSGDLTAVWTPDPGQEALRDLTRARDAAKEDLHRARQRVTKMLLRLGISRPKDMKSTWTKKHESWLTGVRFHAMAQQVVWTSYLEAVAEAKERLRRLTETTREAAAQSPHAKLIGALQCLRGIGLVSAVTWVAELGNIASRFPMARSLMGYAGLGAKEWSSGERRWRGGITKAGNSHVRYVAVEAGWHYRHDPRASKTLDKRREGQPAAVVALAKKAEQRLHRRFQHLVWKRKAAPCAVTAVGRELLGFAWGVALEVAAAETSEAAAA